MRKGHELTVFLDLTWLPTIIEALAIVVGLTFYLANWRARDRLRKVRYANMLLAELETLHRMMKPYDKDDGVYTIENSTEILPHNVYDGLVSSTNLSYFDKPVQNLIHSFYELVIIHDRKFGPKPTVDTFDAFGPTDEDGKQRYLKNSLRQIIREVTLFRDRNQPDERWRPVLKMLRWYYED